MRKLVLVLLAVGLAALTVWLGPPVYRYLLGDEVVLEARVEGLGCGAHLAWEPQPMQVPPGTRIRVTNATGAWKIPVHIEQRDGGSFAVQSDPVGPDESWTVVLWRPGVYAIFSGQPIQQLAGLDGLLIVTSR